MIAIAACSSSQNTGNKVISVSDVEYQTAAGIEEYKIGIGDVLTIDVWKNPDLGLSVPVRPDGKISAPLVGDIVVAGVTPEDVAYDITQRLSKFIRTPNVTVIVTGLASTTYLSRVRVTGAVVQNSSLQHSQGMTVLDAVLAAGGLNEFADAEETKLFRRAGGKTVVIQIDLNGILVEGNLRDNVALEPGDTITIPERMF
ncbi:MAG: sugar ABC transporter substrate-binding protein [Gammaproteobacteria bacterium]|nr:sugar ABC transporter substrate-binding protein [Gammaproteobacteria bacterium]